MGDTPTLLVLDNLEQIVGAATEVDVLLTRCPSVRILCTSRAALRLRAEHEYPVGSLDVPLRAADISAESVMSCSCVQLFVDRARTVRHDFTLDHLNARAVAEICRRLDGLPLAIELAAARTRLLSPIDLLARLETSLDVLGTGPVDLPERQRTVRATVEWSISLLRDQERDLLGTLTVFVDGWTLEAATAIAARPEQETLDLLDTLTGNSLLHVQLTDTGARFGMLESVREIAAELLSVGDDRSEVEHRHATYFRDLVVDMDEPGERRSEWAERLRVEEENIRAAIHWFLANEIAPLPHLFRTLWLYWQLQDRVPDGRMWISELLEKVESFDVQSKLELLLTSAMTAVEVGDDDTALAVATAIDALDEPIENPFLASSANLVLAWVRPIEDDDEGGLRAAVSAYEGYLELDDLVGASGAAMSAGLLSMSLDRSEEARRHFAEVERLGETTGNNWLQEGRRTQLALLEIADGNLDAARHLIVESVGLDDTGLNTNTLAFALVAFAQLAVVEGRAPDAARALGAAAGLRRRAGVRTWPSARKNEDAVTAQVRAALEPSAYDAAFGGGAELDAAGALTMIRELG